MPLSHQEAERLARRIWLDDDDHDSTHHLAVASTEIASLWGGMGRIYKVSVEDNKSFIVKYIDHKASSCRGLAMSDKRKIIQSYQNEANFYQQHSQELIEHDTISLPQALFVECTENTTIICMSRLQSLPVEVPSNQGQELTIEWLAAFHAATWQRPYDVLGSYWHYNTRPTAWRSLANDGLEGRLKRAAKPLDEWLNNDTSLQCLIHGDCKFDNVMWDGGREQVTLCDFQYVGKGCPCKDLAYFLTDSAYSDEEHDSLVERYFEALSSELAQSDKAPLSRDEFNVALDLAYCDYLRFLCAWRGQHQEQKDRITPRVERILDKIDGGSDLGSEDAYRDAIQKYATPTVVRVGRG